MKSFYGLKKSEPTDFVEPIVRYLEQAESQQKAHSFRQSLAKITQLRNKTTSLSWDEPSVELANKFIPALEMYVRYALMLSKHLNWNKEFGLVVDDLKIVWYDSCNPQFKFMKNDIHYDIFCCFYNLGIMYFYKSTCLALEDLISSRKQSAKCAKIAYYLFNTMRTVYYPLFMNTGFSDTDYNHLQMLQSLAQGLIYKNLFNLFKEDEYKIGIDKIASLAGLAQKNFLRGYEIATAYFMKSSNISAAVKSEILSFAYVESLYHDLMFNTRLAKHYEEEMDKSKDNIIYLIAYQRKAARLLDIGLKNQSVMPLLDRRPEEKKDLMKIKPQLEDSLKKNIQRNTEIYKKPQIKEEQIPPPKEPPAQYIAKLEEPQTLKISYEGPIASLFLELPNNESKGFMLELKQFARNRMSGLQSAYTKLNKNIEIIYNDNFVNFYLNLEQNSKNKGIPEALKQRINQIQMNGGKQKIEMEVNILKKNSEQAGGRFQELKKMIMEEQAYDNSKRNQYGNQWRRQPSNLLNRTYINDIQVYQKKAEQANTVNKKILEKYQALTKYIDVVDGNQQKIMSVLPKVEITKFLEENKGALQNLKKGIESVKEKKQGLDSIVDDIKKFYDKLNYNEISANYYKKLEQNNREQIFEEIFSKAYKLVEAFNDKTKFIEVEAQKVGNISAELNKNNKGDEKSKKEFEDSMSKFNSVNDLFRDLMQGTSFYTKMGEILVRISDSVQGYVTARKMEADQLEASFGGSKKTGFGGGNNQGGNNQGFNNNLPNMYPNQPQQNLGFYVPPPMVFSNPQNNMAGYSMFNSNNGGGNNMGDMLSDLMRSKPNFSTDVFGGPVYKSKFT